MSRIICHRFGGIRRINPSFSSECISAKDMQNVELYCTGTSGGVGIRTQPGNVSVSDGLIPQDERIVNIFETIQNGTSNFLVHTINSTQGKVYLFASGKMQVILQELSPAAKSEGIDFMQGSKDLFIFTNGTDDLHYIELGAKATGEIIKAKDREGRAIKGLGLANYQGRLWTFAQNRLHYCQTANVFDWETSDINIPTSAGFIEFPKKITAIHPYISGLAVFFKDSSVIIEGQFPFTVSSDSPGGCAGHNALVFHGTDLFFYDDTKKGIYSFQQVVLGNKTLGNNVALDVQDELKTIDQSRLGEIKLLSVNIQGRNEIRFSIPDKSENSKTFIFDYINAEWIKRVSQKLTCSRVVGGSLYCGTQDGKIVKEYQGKKFDGVFIPSFYKTSPFNAGSFGTSKLLLCLPRLALNMAKNNFCVRYIRDFDTVRKSKSKNVDAKVRDYLIWNASNWAKAMWRGINNKGFVINLPKIDVFKVLEIEFFTAGASEEFDIANLEISEFREFLES